MFSFRSKSTKETINLNIPSRVVIRVVVLVLLALTALATIKQAQHALLLIFTSFFLALALNAPVHWIAQRLPGKRRGSRPKTPIPLSVGTSSAIILKTKSTKCPARSKTG
jgi:predicted PurR-regulated permease PerM